MTPKQKQAIAIYAVAALAFANAVVGFLVFMSVKHGGDDNDGPLGIAGDFLQFGTPLIISILVWYLHR